MTAAPLARTIGGRSTIVHEAGSGPAVLWLHDTFGNRGTPGRDALTSWCRVIAPGLPGFDDSTTLDGIDEPEDVVFWLLDVLDELALERPVLLGCGLGGWMAAEFAVRYPKRLAGLVLVNASGLSIPDALAEDEFALTPPLLRPLLFSDPESELARDWLPDSEPPERAEPTLHARVAAARLAWQFPSSPKLRGRLARATVPTLVVCGAHDRLIPVSHARAYADGLPNARLVVMDDAAHYPDLEQPESFASEVSAFVSSLKTTGKA
jgi:pimeloyl-ACP methyl ester carboxylesterase